MKSVLLFQVVEDDTVNPPGSRKVFFPFLLCRFPGSLRFDEKSFYVWISSVVRGPLLAPSVSGWRDRRKLTKQM
jgi:hypothetical protein